MNRTYGTVGAVAVVLVAAVAAVSAGGVPLGGDGPADSTATPGPAGNGTTVAHDGAHLSLDGAPNQTIAGETDLSPETELAVRVVSDGDSPFLVSESTTVAEDGAFSATVDLSHVSEDASAWVTVVRDGAELANVSARVSAVAGVTPTDGSGDAESGTAFVYDGDRLAVAALENATVRGETALAPGSELTVRLTSTAGASPFLVQRTATVDEDGTFVAEVDLVGVDNGTTFEAVARHDGADLASAEGVVIGGDNVVSTTNTSQGNLTMVPVNDTSPVADEDHNTTLDYDGDALTLEPASDRSIAGETDLPAGTEVTIRLRSAGDSSPFLKSAAATVTEDGRFSAAVNMSAVPAGSTFEVTVRHDGDTVATADGEVVE
ncbi:BGTF surface domain-containing protein [Halosimplex halophilum]|uniref:BGTF surface domain-containing protein n=1 Tax=Halosimplex halophilum TaxID=2559572 RepID=UPI00107F6EB9|nr:BGTF surface domain-containing protein [Halosimplex halophilum]